MNRKWKWRLFLVGFVVAELLFFFWIARKATYTKAGAEYMEDRPSWR